MAVPDFQSLMLPLLRLAGDGLEHAFKDAVEAIAEEFKLTEEERQELIVQLKAEMKTAASLLEFERAAELRDRIRELENA